MEAEAGVGKPRFRVGFEKDAISCGVSDAAAESARAGGGSGVTLFLNVVAASTNEAGGRDDAAAGVAELALDDVAAVRPYRAGTRARSNEDAPSLSRGRLEYTQTSSPSSRPAQVDGWTAFGAPIVSHGRVVGCVRGVAALVYPGEDPPGEPPHAARRRGDDRTRIEPREARSLGGVISS